MKLHNLILSKIFDKNTLVQRIMYLCFFQMMTQVTMGLSTRQSGPAQPKPIQNLSQVNISKHAQSVFLIFFAKFVAVVLYLVVLQK